MEGRATEVDGADNPRAWNPSTKIFSWPATAAFAAWTVAQPVINGALLHTTRLLAVGWWLAGILVIFAVVIAVRYPRASTYRLALSEARSENPDSLVYGIRLDPVTTPVGKDWGDSRAITWGLLKSSADGIEITRASGATMLQRPWSEVTFSAGGIDVGSGRDPEEWWFRFVGDSGMFAEAGSARQRESRIQRLQSLRPIA